MNEDIIQKLLLPIIDDLQLTLFSEQDKKGLQFDDGVLHLGYLSYNEDKTFVHDVSSVVKRSVETYPQTLLHWIWWNSEDGQQDLSRRLYIANYSDKRFQGVDCLAPETDFDLVGLVTKVIFSALLNYAESEYLKRLQLSDIDSQIGKEDLKATFDNLVGLTFSYRSSKKFLAFLQFNVKIKNYSPFNVALIYTQNPNAEYVATQRDWEKLHNREVIHNAKPIIILAPFHPILMVFDVRHTVGEALPDRCFATFWAEGYRPTKELKILELFLQNLKVNVGYKKLGIAHAGYIQKLPVQPTNKKKSSAFKFSLVINESHDDVVKFATLVHEIGHLLCGHLGSVEDIKSRDTLTISEREFEAESISYIVCSRLGINTNSDEYLSGYIQNEAFIPQNVSVDVVLKVASKLEQLVKSGASKFNVGKKRNEKANVDEQDKGQLSFVL